jgi:hypothetical protein
MGSMIIQLKDVMLEHDALHEELGACQRKCFRLEQEIIINKRHLKKHSQGPLR